MLLLIIYLGSIPQIKVIVSTYMSVFIPFINISNLSFQKDVLNLHLVECLWKHSDVFIQYTGILNSHSLIQIIKSRIGLTPNDTFSLHLHSMHKCWSFSTLQISVFSSNFISCIKESYKFKHTKYWELSQSYSCILKRMAWGNQV